MNDPGCTLILLAGTKMWSADKQSLVRAQTSARERSAASWGLGTAQLIRTRLPWESEAWCKACQRWDHTPRPK